MRCERTIEVPLNDGTLKDLVAQYLDAIGIIRETEAVIRMDIGPKDYADIRKVTVMFIEEREPQVIVHK